MKSELPFTPGVELGEAAIGFAIGDRVLGCGAAVLRVRRPATRPSGSDSTAAPPSNRGTLHVHAAAVGGVGSAGIPLGKAAGTRVIGVVGGSEKAGAGFELGADVVVDRLHLPRHAHGCHWRERDEPPSRARERAPLRTLVIEA